MGVAAVRRDAVQGDAQLGVPLVRARHLERGGLADDRAPRQPGGVGVALGQPLRPQGADLLVVGEDEGERRPPALGPRLGREVGREGEEPLHVAGAAPDQALPLVGQREGVVPPPLLLGRHHVHVPGEGQPSPRRLLIRRLGAEPGDDVRLGAVGRGVARDPDAGAVQVVAEEVRQRQVAVAAGGVEADQPGEQLRVRKEGGSGKAFSYSRRRSWRTMIRMPSSVATSSASGRTPARLSMVKVRARKVRRLVMRSAVCPVARLCTP